jgi:hypothetical protein
VATGQEELATLTSDSAFLDRIAAGRGDAAVCLGWKDNIAGVVDAATSQDDWFARTGIESILAHIAKLERGRPFNQQRDSLRQLMKRTGDRVMAASLDVGWGEGVRLERWASGGQEALYTPAVAVTTFLTLMYNEDDEYPYDLHDVVVGDRVQVHASISFNPSTKLGLRDADLMRQWNSLTAAGMADVPGVGRVPLVNDISFATGIDFSGTAAELESLLVEWGIAVLDYLRQFGHPT